jgi:hypothetical protein
MERLVEGTCAIKHLIHIPHIGHVPLGTKNKIYIKTE